MRVQLAIFVFVSALFVPAGLAEGMRQAPSGWVEDEPAPRAAPSAPVMRNGKAVLQGGVEQHSQELRALPRALSVGATFNEAYLQATPPIDGWYRIPSWLGGDWARNQETVVSSLNFQTGQQNNMPHTMAASERAQFGVQRDRRGGIWHCRLANSGVADVGSYMSIALVQTQEPLLVTPSRVVLRDVFTQLHVNKETKAIIFSAQAESITTYEPQSDGTLKTSASIKVFDELGQPEREEHSVAVSFRTKEFLPLDTYKGADLVQSFKQFLISNDKEDLIPLGGNVATPGRLGK